MAGINGTIEFRGETRPAIVQRLVNTISDIDGNTSFEYMEERALVHTVHMKLARGEDMLCEFEDGTMHFIPVNLIRFLDSHGRFKEFAWDAMGANRIESNGTKLSN